MTFDRLFYLTLLFFIYLFWFHLWISSSVAFEVSIIVIKEVI